MGQNMWFDYLTLLRTMAQFGLAWWPVISGFVIVCLLAGIGAAMRWGKDDPATRFAIRMASSSMLYLLYAIVYKLFFV